LRRGGKTGRITGLACATPAPVSFFRSRLALESAEDKKRHTESSFAGKSKVAGGLENYCKRSGQMKTIQAQCNFVVNKCIYSGLKV